MNYDPNYEITVSDRVAHVCGFSRTVGGRSYTCATCGKVLYEPRPNPLINERMIRHYQTHHANGRKEIV